MIITISTNAVLGVTFLYIPNDNLEDPRPHLKSPRTLQQVQRHWMLHQVTFALKQSKKNIHQSSVIIFPPCKSFEIFEKSHSSDLVRPGMQTPQCSFANNCSLAQGCIPAEERFLFCLFLSTCYLGDWVTRETQTSIALGGNILRNVRDTPLEMKWPGINHPECVMELFVKAALIIWWCFEIVYLEPDINQSCLTSRDPWMKIWALIMSQQCDARDQPFTKVIHAENVFSLALCKRKRSSKIQ